MDLFQGQLRSVVCCTVCPNYSVCFDPFMYLALPLREGQHVQTLQDCFADFSTGSKLTGDEQWYCDKCEKKVDATQYLSVYKYPPLLMVLLKRFKTRSSGTFFNLLKNSNKKYFCTFAIFCFSILLTFFEFV